MSNVDTRLAYLTLSLSDRQTLRGWRGVAPRRSETGGQRRRLFAAILFASDFVSGVMAIVAAAVIVARRLAR